MTYVNHNGELDLMSDQEAQAIERSGRCSWQEYAAEPSAWSMDMHPIAPLM